jgi:HSP20 family molecular chaperone IbpA
MKSKIEIPKELLTQIDFQNTVNGGVSQTDVSAWKDRNGYHLILHVPGVNPERIQIKTVSQRFLVSYMVDVLEGTEQVAYHLVNLPLSPEIDVNKISARLDTTNHLFVHAPYNDWAIGNSHHIDIDNNM